MKRSIMIFSLSEEEIEDRSHWTEEQWVGAYILAPGSFGKVYLLGGTSKCPQDWLLRQIDRYAEKVFSTPGYEPFNEHAWSTGLRN